MGTVIEAVVLDLDDTLYLERDYVRSGFASVAGTLEELGIADAREAFEHLWSQFKDGRRGDAFDSLARNFPFQERTSVPDLIARYRTHRPNIALLDPEGFDALASSVLPIGLISDGIVEPQLRKMEALGLQDRFNVTVLTGAWGRDFWKPHPRAFEMMEMRLGISGERLAYVADNPTKDFIAPNGRGWTSIRLRVEGQLHYGAEPANRQARPRLEVSSLSAISELLGHDRSRPGGGIS